MHTEHNQGLVSHGIVLWILCCVWIQVLNTATAVAESTVNSDAGRLPAKALAVSGHEAQAESLDSVFRCG